MRYDFDGGKYTVISENGRQQALRHGEPWRDLTGDNLVYWMMVEIEVLTNAHPTPAVVRQLVDGLAGLIDFIEIDNLKIDQDALRIAKAALAAVKENGL